MQGSELRTVIHEAGTLGNREGKQDATQKLHPPAAKRHRGLYLAQGLFGRKDQGGVREM